MSGLEDLAIFDASAVAARGLYGELVDALERAHQRPAPVVDRIVYGPEGSGDRMLALPAWQPDEAIGVKLVTESNAVSKGKLVFVFRAPRGFAQDALYDATLRHLPPELRGELDWRVE